MASTTNMCLIVLTAVVLMAHTILCKPTLSIIDGDDTEVSMPGSFEILTPPVYDGDVIDLITIPSRARRQMAQMHTGSVHYNPGHSNGQSSTRRRFASRYYKPAQTIQE
ncbi:unnamed protein product [Lymnaea stagnalis]|uniref:Secreted protein n=1 Tax=Lymnaea stagnalis TaxID=6523 RepID=A0AAV2HCS0_LYMST